MKQLDDYFTLQQQIYDYFGYLEDWVVIPLEDKRESHWHLTGDGPGGEVIWVAEPLTDALFTSEQYYSASIYTQRHLPKWVYRGPEYTMVCADTHTDGNKFLMVFDNTKEHKGSIPEDL